MVSVDYLTVNRDLIDHTRDLRALPDWLAAAMARLQGQCAPALGIHDGCEHDRDGSSERGWAA